MAIADSFDAMTTNRIYKPRKSVEEALQELCELSGTQFDPQIVPSALKALSSVAIVDSISQLPSSAVEEERFAYFYKDRVTHLYNQHYLDTILAKNAYSKYYKCINVLSIHNFSLFNDTFGWLKGDEILLDFAQFLREKFPNRMIFRLHANDFIILSNEHIELPIHFLENLAAVSDNHLTSTNFHLHIQNDEVFTLEKLEEYMREDRQKRRLDAKI